MKGSRESSGASGFIFKLFAVSLAVWLLVNVDTTHRPPGCDSGLKERATRQTCVGVIATLKVEVGEFPVAKTIVTGNSKNSLL